MYEANLNEVHPTAIFFRNAWFVCIFLHTGCLYEGLKVMREELLRKSTADRGMNRAAPIAGSKDAIMTYSEDKTNRQIVVK